MAVYFLSDLHLGAPYFPDSRAAEIRVVRWLESIRHDAEVLYLLGDILDYWYEYRYVVPRGFVRFFGKLAQLTDSGVRVVWLIGNHDIWIRDYIPSELGVEVHDGSLVETIQGKRIFMAHGDGVGRLPLGFRFIRSVFRNRLAQWLFSGIHPRWTVPFAYSWSRHSRATGRAPDSVTHPALDHLKTFALDYLSSHPDTDYFLFGHLHIVVDEEIAPGTRLLILGDWITRFTYARMEAGEIKLKTFLSPPDLK